MSALLASDSVKLNKENIMKNIRIFDTQDDHINKENPAPCDGDAFTHLCEFSCVGNDSYHDWTVDDADSGGGYVTKDEQADFNTWLKKAGAKPGEKLLIYLWW